LVMGERRRFRGQSYRQRGSQYWVNGGISGYCKISAVTVQYST
jgi:hypothetical protein